MSTHSPDLLPAAASLENPLYYLENMETVVAWVTERYGDLLTPEERQRMQEFFRLSRPARALLTRMVMRTGELFRSDRLNYPELGVPEAQALSELIQDHWLDGEPELGLDDLFRLYTLAELRPVFAPQLQQLGAPAKLPKARMRELLETVDLAPRRVGDWLAAAQVLRLRHMELFDRIRLMFFGNLHQSWSDFVLVELGLQRYQSVSFSADSRAFRERAEVDCYLAMHQCRQQLDQGTPAREVWLQVPPASPNPWLSGRRDRLLLELGRQAERQGDRELALEALADSGHRDARIKRLRLLERMKRYREAWSLLPAGPREADDSETLALERIRKRLAPKLGEPAPETTPSAPILSDTVTLPKPQSATVEQALAEFLWQDSSPVYYVENTLFNGLFGLLCWNSIFEPVPGAFFHPFHSGPADLNREDFVSRRQASFDSCLKRLQNGSYRRQIVDNWHDRQGIANPFVAWPVLTEELLMLALECIPPAHLDAVFRRLLVNIPEHRSGFPDLIRFRPHEADLERRYEMIEVKGPGDRLQDHQTRWLQFFGRQGMAARVCYVNWQDSGDAP